MWFIPIIFPITISIPWLYYNSRKDSIPTSGKNPIVIAIKLSPAASQRRD